MIKNLPTRLPQDVESKIYFGDANLVIPVSFAISKNNFSKQHIRVFIQILKKLQDDLHKLITLNKRSARLNSADQNLMLIFQDSSISNSSDDKYEIVMKFSDLKRSIGIKANNAYDLEQSLIQISRLPIQMPIQRDGADIGGKAGEKIEFTRYDNLCGVDISSKRTSKVAVFRFSPEIAKRFLNTDLGYFNIVESVIMNLSNVHAQKIYLLLSQLSDNITFELKESKLRSRLGIENTYPEKKKLRTVLSRAKVDIDRLFDEGRSDLSFNFKFDESGSEMKIKFVIEKNILKNEEYLEKVKYSKNRVDRWLRGTFRMTDEVKINRYIELTTPEKLFEIEDKFNYIIDILKDAKKSSKIVDKRAYILTSIDNLFKDIASIPEVE